MPDDPSKDWTYVGVITLDKCIQDKYFVITPHDLTKIKDYTQAIQIWGKDHCQ